MSAPDAGLTELLAGRLNAPKVVNVDVALSKWVIFRLADNWYAFSAAHVREILTEPRVYFLPGCPSSMEGVINVRGDIESVLLLGNILRQDIGATPRPSHVLLSMGAGISSGVRVDRVEDVVDLPENLLQDAPHPVPGHLQDLVLGVIPYRDRLVTVLDIDRIFEDYRQGLL